MSTAYGLVLAGGRSSRMGFNKLIEVLAGRPVISYAVENLQDSGVDRIIATVPSETSEVARLLGDGVRKACQHEPLGTGHAVLVALSELAGSDHVVVLFGDCPFIDGRTISDVHGLHVHAGADVTIATTRLQNPNELGIVRRNEDGSVCQVASARENLPWMNAVNEVFAGLSVWRCDVLRQLLPDLPRRPRASGADEYELPDAIGMCAERGGVVHTFSISEEHALGLNDIDQFYKAESYIRQRTVTRLREDRVRVLDGASIHLDVEVRVGAGALLRGPVSLHGRTTIGENAAVGPNTTLVDCTVGDDCVVGAGAWEGATFPAGSRVADRYRERNRYFEREQYLIPTEEDFCVFLTPFREPFATLFENVIRPTVESEGLRCRLGAETINGGIITKQVWEDINRARLVIAEISERNTSVWYELGLAHALNKPTFLLTKDPDFIAEPGSFMARILQILCYDPERGDLGMKLREWIRNGEY